jgi:hypothetical protein
MATVNMKFCFTVTKVVNIEDTEDSEDLTVEHLTRQLQRLGFKVSLEDSEVVDEDEAEEDEIDEDDEENG